MLSHRLGREDNATPAIKKRRQKMHPACGIFSTRTVLMDADKTLNMCYLLAYISCVVDLVRAVHTSLLALHNGSRKTAIY